MFAGTGRLMEDVIAVDVLDRIERRERAVAAARGDHGKLEIEIDEAFEDRGYFADRAPRPRRDRRRAE